MSGHSKWNNIKNKKGVTDAKKGRAFGEIGRHIRMAVKEGGSGDPGFNPALRLALEKAREVNMPKANIDRAIERGLGKTAGGKIIDEVIYEGYGPGGIGLLISALTDNHNRTSAEVRGVLEKAGGSLGGPGSAAYLFEVKPGFNVTVKVPMPLGPEDETSAKEMIESLESLDDVELVVTNMAINS
jgi:YebC/PmpR family DNA-binding regulatory protein